VLLGWDWIHAN
jgi:hypothetical protein